MERLSRYGILIARVMISMVSDKASPLFRSVTVGAGWALSAVGAIRNAMTVSAK